MIHFVSDVLFQAKVEPKAEQMLDQETYCKGCGNLGSCNVFLKEGEKCGDAYPAEMDEPGYSNPEDEEGIRFNNEADRAEANEIVESKVDPRD